jgi:hypothetical protein
MTLILLISLISIGLLAADITFKVHHLACG